MWKVYKRGPRRLDGWRIVYEGPEVRARRRYRRELVRMRRGHLLLASPEGPVCNQWMPR